MFEYLLISCTSMACFQASLNGLVHLSADLEGTKKLYTELETSDMSSLSIIVRLLVCCVDV